jgi:pectate lyase-like protein
VGPQPTSTRSEFFSFRQTSWRVPFAGLAWLLFVGTLLTPARVLPQSPAASTIPAAGEEFVGPFSSWTNLKSAYHAAGDGNADDTAAIQRALDELGTEGHSPVLFVPSGRYRITRTLTLTSRLNVSILGEDPASVTIVWDGPSGGTMLLVNGVAYSRFARLTYDGRGRASVAVEQSWDNLKPNFDTGNEYSDHSFVDVEYGIRGGFKDHGFAETSIVRSHFVRNTKAGVALGNFNALDIWIWYSTFEDCAIGVTNEPGAGNFRVYGSVFRRSTVSDLFIKNTGGFSARGNYSKGSKAFFLSAGPIAHPATIEIQGNTILDSVDPATIRLGNQGPGLLLDNVIRGRPGANGPVVMWRSFIDADVASVGNTFTLPNAVSSNGRLIAVDDRVAAASTINPDPPALPPVPVDLHRPVFEVESGADGAAIQRAIDRAAERPGTRPIVHVPFGVHTVSRTLTIPPGDLQLVGDGYGTVLKWAGADRGPVLRIAGPSKATLRELQIDGAAKADTVVVQGVDQPRARLYFEGVQTRSGSESNLFLDHLRNATVQATDFGHAYAPKGVSVRVLGGKLRIFSGASAGNSQSYEAADGASVVLRDLWYEGDAPRGFATVHDQASFTLQASRVASPATPNVPAITVSNLNGRLSILTTHIDDRLAIVGNGARADVLGLGTLREYQETNYIENTTAPPATVLMATGRQRTKVQGRFSPGTMAMRDVGNVDSGFIRSMLTDARADVLPDRLTALPDGVSDVRMFRVWAGGGLNNIIVRP